jgi:hypothetical protein
MIQNLLQHLTNPIVFAVLCAMVALALCYGDKCIFKYTVDNNVYYVKIAMLVFALVLGGIYGHRFINAFVNKAEFKNLQTGSAEF